MKFDFLKIEQCHDDVSASLMHEKLYKQKIFGPIPSQKCRFVGHIAGCEV